MSTNLAAIATLLERFPRLDLVLVESGGDNLTAMFSPDLVDRSIYVIDVAGGDKIPRKGGPGVTESELLIINKIDLAPAVGASLMHAPNGGAIVTLLTPAAALFNGDVIDLDVECAVGADVTLVTTGATRLNRGRAESHLSARVEAGAILRYVPCELIPFSGASYRQSIAIDLEPGPSAVVLEVVTPGASFTYDRLDFETCVAVHGTTVVRERFIMTPASRNRLLGFTHYGSLLAIGPTFDAAAADVAHTRLACAGVWGSASVVAGRHGVAVKALGRTAQTLRAALLGSLTPDLARGLHHELELAPHLVPREQVAEGG